MSDLDNFRYIDPTEKPKSPEYQEILDSCVRQSVAAINPWSFLTSPANEYIPNLSNCTLVECIDRYAATRGNIHPSLVESAKLCKKHITELQNSLHLVLKPSQISSIFYEHFINYLREKGLQLSSIETICNSIRAILTWACKYQAVVHPSYTDIDIPKFRREHIALSADEISRIYHFDLHTIRCRPQLRATLERVRDMFVLSCNLGQRHSDMIRINKTNFSSGKFHIIQQKTKNKAIVNLSELTIDRKTTREILDKYNYEAPYKRDKSNYNKHIHQLMHFIFGEEMVSPTIIEGNIALAPPVLKYKIISSHTCRRSFASYNYIVKNFPARKVMKATGHSSESSFKKYICYDDEDEE